MEKRINEIAERRAEIRSLLEGSEKVDLQALEAELNALSDEEKEIRAKQLLADKINDSAIETRSIEKPVTVQEKTEERTMDINSMEYRKQFFDFVRTGQKSEEFRAISVAANNSAVIPSTIQNSVIHMLEGYGKLLPLITRSNYKGGYSVPVMSLTGAAQWITDATMSTTGITPEAATTSSVVFGNYILAKEIGISFLLENTSIEAFENAVASEIARAFVKSLESGIVNGTGTNQMKGVLVETPAATVTLSASPTYKDLVKLRKQIPSGGYSDGAILAINEQTFWDFIGIVDQQGNPVARMNINIDGSPIYSILGLKVVTSDAIPSLDSASASGVVGAIFQPEKYVINSSYEMDMRVFDENHTRNRIYSAAMICDGKLVDTNGLLHIKKSA